MIEYYDPYLEEHHPTCKGGCGQLADECMCNWVWPPERHDTLDTEGVDPPGRF